MKSCIEPDMLLSIGQAIDWDVDRLDHVHACAECRTALDELIATHGLLVRTDPVRPGFAADVMAAVAVAAEKPRRKAAWVNWLNPLLAGMAAATVSMVARPAPWALATSAAVASLVVLGLELRSNGNVVEDAP